MNTYTNSMHPKKVVSQTTRNRLFQNAASMTVILVLVIVAVTAIYLANQPVTASNNAPVTYGNAMELQYARPWLDAQQQILLLNCHSSLEMLYACQYGHP